MSFRRFSLLAVIMTLLAVLPSVAMARGYGRRGGMVYTPFGSMNTNSPEYKMAGGNPFVYQQLMEEKMLMQQQMMMLKQQQKLIQQMQKQAKTKKGSTGFQPAMPANTAARFTTRKKKKGKSVTATKPASASALKEARGTTSSPKSETAP